MLVVVVVMDVPVNPKLRLMLLDEAIEVRSNTPRN